MGSGCEDTIIKCDSVINSLIENVNSDGEYKNLTIFGVSFIGGYTGTYYSSDNNWQNTIFKNKYGLKSGSNFGTLILRNLKFENFSDTGIFISHDSDMIMIDNINSAMCGRTLNISNTICFEVNGVYGKYIKNGIIIHNSNSGTVINSKFENSLYSSIKISNSNCIQISNSHIYNINILNSENSGGIEIKESKSILLTCISLVKTSNFGIEVENSTLDIRNCNIEGGSENDDPSDYTLNGIISIGDSEIHEENNIIIVKENPHVGFEHVEHNLVTKSNWSPVIEDSNGVSPNYEKIQGRYIRNTYHVIFYIEIELQDYKQYEFG